MKILTCSLLFLIPALVFSTKFSSLRDYNGETLDQNPCLCQRRVGVIYDAIYTEEDIGKLIEKSEPLIRKCINEMAKVNRKIRGSEDYLIHKLAGYTVMEARFASCEQKLLLSDEMSVKSCKSTRYSNSICKRQLGEDGCMKVTKNVLRSLKEDN
ncbi:unnamed protein product [Caenorhabditis angaria]|uniref:DUF19 domain-containing protein n=1 Tax=Caenorhabditis angaria TaxID=860376 RepID=A0A9P1NBB7_9PELO|nr:unnamed protein product [Caenorhabditis angaria]